MNNSPEASVPIQTLLLIAVFYAVFGVLGLSLAISPGYASPVFPAAGFALAVALRFGPRILPAVWLGSFLLNVGVALNNDNLSSRALLVAACIGAGGALQAGLGSFLINRWSTDKWQYLEQEKDVLQFSLLGGVVACLISATIGISCLMLASIVPSTELGYAWWNWYVGDTLGVLISAPLVIGLLLRRHFGWGTRLKALVLPVLGTLLLAFALFVGTARWENWSQKAKLDEQGALVAAALEHRFIAHRETLAALARAIEVAPELSLTQFEHFASATLQVQPDIFALSFNPYVTLARRDAFERQMATKYQEGKFQITERNSDRQLVRAGERPEYISVGYISPLAGNRPAVGFDINSEPKRRDAIARAQQSGQIAATESIRLVQESKERVGVLLIAPVFEQSRESLATVAQKGLIGFAVAVIKVDEMVDIALKGLMSPGLVVSIEDPFTDKANRVLYRSESKSAVVGREPVWQTRLMMADREWTLRLFVTEAYVQQHRSWIAWGVGVAGLLFVGLLQLFLLAMTGRTALIARKVAEQTEEISVKNAALIKSEEKYRSVVESVKEVIFQTDAKGAWTFLNPAWTEVTGFAVQDSLGKWFLNFVHPDDHQRNIDLFEALMHRQKDSCRHETRYLRENGDFCWVEVYARLTLDAGDQVVGIAGTLLDVTERRMGEQALRENESRLRSITDSTHDAILIMSPDGQICFWNPAAESLFGYSKEEAIGQDLHLLLAPRRYHDIVERSLVHFYETGQGNAIGKISDFFAVRKDGVEISISLSLAAHKVGDGWHAIGIIRDTTELRRLEQLKEDVDRIMRHDLKTPLNGIIGLAEVLKNDGGLSKGQLLVVDTLSQAGWQMLHMINLSIDLFKIETGRYEYDPEYVDIIRELTSVIKQKQSDITTKQLSINVKLDNAPLADDAKFKVASNQRLLFCILTNLVANAIEASPHGELVDINIQRGDPTVLTIRNKGAVPKSIREVFYQKYVTYGKNNGTGLGTYSAKIMADAMNYELQMETWDEEDTTEVRVLIPNCRHDHKLIAT